MKGREGEPSDLETVPKDGAKFLVVYKCASSGQNQFIQIFAKSAKEAVDTLRLVNPAVCMSNCTTFLNCSPMNADSADGPLVEWSILKFQDGDLFRQRSGARRRVRAADKALKLKTEAKKKKWLDNKLAEERKTQEWLDNRKGK